MRILGLLLAILFVRQANAQTNDLFVRVIDVGPGLCCVVRMPGGHFMIYDAGDDSKANAKISEVIPKGSAIDLLILSHSDSDHLGSVPYICANYKVKHIIYSGLPKPSSSAPDIPTTAWINAVRAIKKEGASAECTVFNLAKKKLVPGTTYNFGPTKVTMVFGMSKPPASWGFTPSNHSSEFYNSGSIVARLEYKNKSILFCGDSVGRYIGDPTNICMAAEFMMVSNRNNVTIDSDVMIAPHHGADNGSSVDFIAAVSPRYVVFSAGTLHKHPKAVTAFRYQNAGVALTNMFRTDLGDKQRPDEWTYRAGTGDSAGDDDVDIVIRGNGLLSVSYRN